MNQVLVIGRPRTGTSALAGVLHHLGVSTGPMSPAASSTTGAFEDDDFVRVFNRLLGDWANPQEWLAEMRPEIRPELSDLIAMRDATHEIWALKTPQLCFLAPWIFPFLTSPTVFYTDRDFDASVASLAKRNSLPPAVASHIQSRYYVAKLRTEGIACSSRIGGFLIRYEDLLAEPRALTEKIVEILDLDVDAFTLERAWRSVRPELKTV